MLINKVIFISSLAFKHSISVLLNSLISPRHRSMNISSLRFGMGDLDVLSPLRSSVVLVSKLVVYFGPSTWQHWHVHWTPHSPCQTWIHLQIRTTGIFPIAGTRTSYSWPCPPCRRCRFHSIFSCKPCYFLWNLGITTQTSYAIGTSCPHLHTVSIRESTGKS